MIIIIIIIITALMIMKDNEKKMNDIDNDVIVNDVSRWLCVRRRILQVLRKSLLLTCKAPI